MSMYNKMSSWRKQVITLKSGLNEVDFLDSTPNVFYVINNNPTYLYMGVSNIPTVNNHDKALKPNTADVFGRPLPVSKLYILNPYTSEVHVELYSDFQNFDMGLLKSLNVDIDKEVLEYIKFDGIVKGWNTTDEVNVKVMNQENLPVELGEESLGQIIGAIKELTGGVTLESVFGTVIFTESNEVIHFNSPVREIMLLSNDTDRDLVIDFNVDTVSQEILLKSGEVLDGVKYMNFTDMSVTVMASDGGEIQGYLRYIVAKEVIADAE